MAHITTINGRRVCSDKQVESIIGPFVHFTDGSWCNVSTGEIYNAGPGYVNIGGSNESGNTTAKNITVGPKHALATALELNGIDADVQVDVHDDKNIVYSITGPKKLVDAIMVSVRNGDTIVFESHSPSPSHNTTIIQSGFGRTVVSGADNSGVTIGNGIFMNGNFGYGNSATVITGRSEGTSEIKVTIKVPRPIAIKSNYVVGNVVIGDTDGTLVANVRAHAVNAGRVGDVQLSVQGSGGINVDCVTGSVMAQVQGSGNIEIKDGTMPSLSATVQGSGDIRVGGSYDRFAVARNYVVCPCTHFAEVCCFVVRPFLPPFFK